MRRRSNLESKSQLDGGDGSKTNSDRRDAGLRGQGPIPMAVHFALLLGSQPRAPDSQHFHCQEDTIKPLDEASSHSSSSS